MNRHLLLLLVPKANRTPRLSGRAVIIHGQLVENVGSHQGSLTHCDVWRIPAELGRASPLKSQGLQGRRIGRDGSLECIAIGRAISGSSYVPPGDGWAWKRVRRQRALTLLMIITDEEIVGSVVAEQIGLYCFARRTDDSCGSPP